MWVSRGGEDTTKIWKGLSMAWTSSATQWRSFAPSAALAWAQVPTVNPLLCLAMVDRARVACVAFAAFLTTAGVAAPNLSAEFLSAILLLAGALSALLALGSAHGSPERNFSDVKSAVQHAGRTTQSVPATRATARITELLTRTPYAGTDPATWAKLTAHMSHELRTPLNAVLGFSELMSNETFGPLGSSHYRAYAQDIHASGRQLLKSAEDALAITAILTATERRGGLASTSVLIAADEAIAFHDRELKASGITVACAIPGDVEIVAEGQTLRQILINLIREAIAVAGRDTHLSVELEDTGGEIVLAVILAGHNPVKQARVDSFAVILARTLVELSGASHFRIDDGNPAASSAAPYLWRASARFARASQADFFQRARI